MHRVQTGPLIGFAGLLLLLGGLEVTAGLGAGWFVGVGCGAVVTLVLGAALAQPRREGRGLGPAGRITLVRAELVCAVAALAVGASAVDASAVATLVALATVALVLDGVDGQVARRTGTVSELGARFDMEVDALLILVLSAYVAPAAGWWVLLIGAARYAFVAAGRLLPWLRGTLPPRPWCKVVAVVQGVVLIVVATRLLPLVWERAGLVAALSLLTESFGREVRDLWRARAQPAERDAARAGMLVGRG